MWKIHRSFIQNETKYSLSISQKCLKRLTSQPSAFLTGLVTQRSYEWRLINICPWSQISGGCWSGVVTCAVTITGANSLSLILH